MFSEVIETDVLSELVFSTAVSSAPAEHAANTDMMITITSVKVIIDFVFFITVSFLRTQCAP